MDDATALDVMKRFGRAFFKKDPALLGAAITPDAEWHQDAGPDAPHGRVRRGVQGFLEGIAEEDALYESARFNDVVIRAFSEDQIVMTYVIDGQYQGGATFSLRGLELLTVRDGRVSRKDVFMKQWRKDEGTRDC